MIDQKGIRDSIPNECEPELSHILTHIRSAQEAEAQQDLGQLAHDTSMAARLLLVLCWDTEKRMSEND